MKVLVIGSGGREHTIAWKIKQSPKVKKIYCAPGNAGIREIAEIINIKPEDISGLLRFVKENRIDLTIVGPEVPLALGITDEFEKQNIRIFGPNKTASQLESSKIFSKEKMKKYGISTAESKAFYEGEIEKALTYIDIQKNPVVIKADGLAQGKGVVVTENKEEAKNAVISAMRDDKFQGAGRKIIIEERMFGEEASVLAFVDGKSFKTMASAQDHKAIYDNDEGPNTGGMGAYSPAPVVTKEILKKIEDEIFTPMIKGLIGDGIIYKGVLYAGLMITKDGPKVIEFNVRFGDPETQVILPRLKNDLIDIINAVIDEKLEKTELSWDERSCVCVVLASSGYPDSYEKGYVIKGLDRFTNEKEIVVFHAGTKYNDKKEIITDGGRVLGVTAYGVDIENAIKNAYNGVGHINFQNIYYRKDIGCKARKKTMKGR